METAEHRILGPHGRDPAAPCIRLRLVFYITHLDISSQLPLHILECLAHSSSSLPSVEVKVFGMSDRERKVLVRELVHRVKTGLEKLVLQGDLTFSPVPSHEAQWRDIEAPDLREVVLHGPSLSAIEHLRAPILRQITFGESESAATGMLAVHNVIAAGGFPNLKTIKYGLMAPELSAPMPGFVPHWSSLKEACAVKDIQLSLALTVTGSLSQIWQNIRRAVGAFDREIYSLEVNLHPAAPAFPGHPPPPPSSALQLPALIDMAVLVLPERETPPTSEELRIRTASRRLLYYLRELKAPSMRSLELEVMCITPVVLRFLQNWTMQKQVAPNLERLQLKGVIIAGWGTRNEALSALSRMKNVLAEAGVDLTTKLLSATLSTMPVLEL